MAIASIWSAHGLNLVARANKCIMLRVSPAEPRAM